MRIASSMLELLWNARVPFKCGGDRIHTPLEIEDSPRALAARTTLIVVVASQWRVAWHAASFSALYRFPSDALVFPQAGSRDSRAEANNRNDFLKTSLTFIGL